MPRTVDHLIVSPCSNVTTTITIIIKYTPDHESEEESMQRCVDFIRKVQNAVVGHT